MKTYQDWYEAHEDELNKVLGHANHTFLRRLYDTFADAIYCDGFDDGWEQAQEEALGEREEELG